MKIVNASPYLSERNLGDILCEIFGKENVISQKTVKVDEKISELIIKFYVMTRHYSWNSMDRVITQRLKRLLGIII